MKNQRPWLILLKTTHDLTGLEMGGPTWWSGIITGLISSSLPLVIGIAAGWSLSRVFSYTLLALLYLALLWFHLAPSCPAKWMIPRLSVYLLVMGFVGLMLLAVGGDPYILPMVFTIPIVQAAISYSASRTALVGLLYVGMIALGLWLNGHRTIGALLLPAAAYGALMTFLYAFTWMAVEQGLARQRADRLAADLARQRDYLARLAEVTATLTRDLDLATVLEQVATAGQSLAYAKQVRIWLRSPVSKNSAVRLAAAAPPMPEAPLLTPHEQQALLVAAAKVSDTALILPLIVKDECIGALELRDQDRATFTTGDVQLLQPFANAAAVAIENARLYEQAHLSATLSERNRLARELHDTIAQGLTAVTMQLEAAQRSFERDPSRSRARLGRAYELARATLDDVRRSVWTLAAPLTDGRALRETLEEQGGAFAQRTGVVISYRHAGPPVQLDSAAATQVMRIVQEALHNVEKHAQATEVVIGSQTSFDELRVWVCDNGVGFDPNVSRSNGVNGSGFGLASLHERARLAKGFLEVESGPEIGTTISITIRQSRSSDAEDEHGLYFS